MDNAKGSKMNEPKPLALRLADACDTLTKLMLVVPGLDTVEAAAELRRLHKEVEQLRDRLLDMYYMNSMNA